MKPRGQRKSRPIPEVLTVEEQGRLLGQLEPATCPSKVRNFALVRLLLNTGLRASEARALKVRDIDWQSGQLMVRNGKGGKDRSLWLSNDDLGLLKDWLDIKPKTSSNGLLFTSLDGSKPICARWLRKFVKRLAEKARIDKRVHPHTLRHSFATRLLKYTKNIFLVSRALGHAHLSTTEIYLHLHDHELEEALRGMSNGNP